MIYLNTNGISSDKPTEKFWVCEWQNTYSLKEGDNTPELDFKLIELTHLFADRLFGSVQKLYNKLPFLSTVFPYAGVDAEIKISKKEFEKWIASHKSVDNHKILFYYDIQNLVGSLQNLISESKFLFCDFYKTLNANTFMLADKPHEPNIVMFASGQIVTGIFSKVNHLFINLASQLDFITKVGFEIENPTTAFTDYPKLKSNSILYGDAKRIKHLDKIDTVFNNTDSLRLILSLRNEIIHNASFENIPKVYQVFKDGKQIEKFIFIPDSTNGVLDSFKNRNRFFSTDIKLNEILPDLITDFWKTMEITVDKLKTTAN